MFFQEKLTEEIIRRKTKKNIQGTFRRISHIFLQAQISFKI